MMVDDRGARLASVELYEPDVGSVRIEAGGLGIVDLAIQAFSLALAVSVMASTSACGVFAFFAVFRKAIASALTASRSSRSAASRSRSDRSGKSRDRARSDARRRRRSFLKCTPWPGRRSGNRRPRRRRLERLKRGI